MDEFDGKTVWIVWILTIRSATQSVFRQSLSTWCNFALNALPTCMFCQIRPGMDLSRISFPTFILEPRSFLDKLSDSFYHSNYISQAVQTPVRRANLRYNRALFIRPSSHVFFRRILLLPTTSFSRSRVPLSAYLQDKVERFLQIVKWYIAGFYKKPKGLKKPYNPLLGEIFRCVFVCPPLGNLPETRTTMVCEQVRT